MLVLLVFATSGCQHRLPPETTTVQLSVPFYPQQRYQCGPAALASMLSDAGVPATPEVLVDEVWLPGRKGSLTMELVAAARSRGLLVYPLNDMDALRAELEAGHPALVQLNLLFDWWPKWHFAVVTGYGPSHVVLHSGKQHNQRVPLDWLDDHWRKADYTGFVMLPAHQLPASAKASTLLAAISDLEHSLDGAQPGWWQAAADRFDANAMLRFGLGNARFAKGDMDRAREAFRQALQRDETLAPAWNNLAWLLWQNNSTKEALAAVERALALDPENPDYLDTRAQILSTSGDGQLP